MNSASLQPAANFRESVLPRRSVLDGQHLDPGDPAIHAITDFTRELPITVDEDRQIDAALEDMIHFGVRAMLVMRGPRIVGLITSYDIQGERPLQFLQSSTYTRHQDLRVGHVMTPWDKLLAMEWNTVHCVRAGDLLHILEEADLTHLLVIERGSKSADPIVRALVSRARLARQIRGLLRSSGARLTGS
jgi:CBS domain-containing protein